MIRKFKRLWSVMMAVFLFLSSLPLSLFNCGTEKMYFNSLDQNKLNSYLDRAVSHCYFYSLDDAYIAASKRFVLNTGAKYIARANTMWSMHCSDARTIARQALMIEDVHESDPEIIFEACIFETTFTSVEEIAIPAFVFAAFDLEPVERNFDYEAMLFEDGSLIDQWGQGGSVPDITRIETQLFFYYRAALFIDAGFEALHMGQIHLYGKNDKRFENATNLFNKIRTYATDHARRGWVLLNAHTHGITGSDGLLLFDFHMWPSRVNEPKGLKAHTATEDNPQKAVLKIGQLDSIYGDSMGGKTHAGWFTLRLPYLVELDNWNGHDPDSIDIPNNKDYSVWGYDEISWFANQPFGYQSDFLHYAYDWVTTVDGPQGHFAMPGTRTAAIKTDGIITQKDFFPFLAEDYPGGSGVEEILKEIWQY